MAIEYLKPISYVSTSKVNDTNINALLGDPLNSLGDPEFLTSISMLDTWSAEANIAPPTGVINGDLTFRYNVFLGNLTTTITIRQNGVVLASHNLFEDGYSITQVFSGDFESHGQNITVQFSGVGGSQIGDKASKIFSVDVMVDVSPANSNPPNVPSNLSPLDSYITNSLNPIFSGTVSHVDSLKTKLIIKIASDINFTTNFIEIKSEFLDSGSGATLTSPLFSGTWYWKAQSESENLITSSESETRVITINNNKPDTPINLTPNDGESISSSQVLFSGTVSDIDYGELRLIVEVSNDELFNNPIILTSNPVNSGEIASVDDNDNITLVDTYFWRARTFDGEKYSDYTPVKTFTLVNLAPSITQMTPATQSRLKNSDDVAFRLWYEDGNGDTVRIHLELSNYSTFNPLNTSYTTMFYESGTSIIINVYDLPNGIYYWRARAEDSNGMYSAYTNTFVFYMEIPVYETISPNTILSYSGLSGSIGNIMTADANWITSNANTASSVMRIGFSTPSNNLAVGDLMQIIRLQARRTNISGIPSVTMQLYHNGVVVYTGTTNPFSISSTTGEYFEFKFNANVLPNLTGEYVEVEIKSDSYIGNGKTRTDADFGHVEWIAYVDYNAGTVVVNNPPVANIVSVDRTKVSNIVGVDRATVVFTFDKDVVEWTVNVGGNSYSTGVVADSGFGTVSAGTQISAVVDYTELLQEGNNRVNIYGKDSSGVWASYKE